MGMGSSVKVPSDAATTPSLSPRSTDVASGCSTVSSASAARGEQSCMVQSDLGADFSSFKLEDERHWAVTGTASADATFGMACCMSLAAEAQLRGHSSAMAQ